MGFVLHSFSILHFKYYYDMRKLFLTGWLFILPAFLFAQDPALIQKIREEGLKHSQVMEIAF